MNDYAQGQQSYHAAILTEVRHRSPLLPKIGLRVPRFITTSILTREKVKDQMDKLPSSINFVSGMIKDVGEMEAAIRICTRLSLTWTILVNQQHHVLDMHLS
jgi:hypothetical protein